MSIFGKDNLTLLEQGKRGAVKAALDEVEKGDKEIQVEGLTSGDVEVDVNVPITKGFLKGATFTAFAKTKVQQLKQAVGGFRVTKKFL